MINVARKEWPAALCALPADEVKQLATALSGGMEVRDVALPHAGLGLLSLRDGAFQEAYFIGEMPLARAEVIVQTAHGEAVRGGALIVDDRAQFARSIAILDAVLSGQLPGWEHALALVRHGMEVRRQKHNDRKKLLAATRVDFSLLGQEDDEDEEE